MSTNSQRGANASTKEIIIVCTRPPFSFMRVRVCDTCKWLAQRADRAPSGVCSVSEACAKNKNLVYYNHNG